MSVNSFGQAFRWTSFGESHGVAMGVVIDGCPAGVDWSSDILEDLLRRRRPGHSQEGEVLVSERKEADQYEVLSGVFEEKTLGTPIGIIIRNTGQRSKDYEPIKNNPRVGHADDVWKDKFGHVDYRGGGRASARETVSRVLAGGVAKMLAQNLDSQMQVYSYVEQVGPLKGQGFRERVLDRSEVQGAFLGFSGNKEELKSLLSGAKENGESYGGTIVSVIKKPTAGLGQPVFKKLKADLGSAFFSIGASLSVELGLGFEGSLIKGSEFHTNMNSSVYGGIRGGISTGEDIVFRIHFKPTSSIKDVAKQGRHDPCIVPRACPVVESMVWSCLADHLLLKRLDRV